MSPLPAAFLLATVLLSQSGGVQPLRRRTILENGATIYVERVPDSKSVSVQLFISARDSVESPQNNGQRHLMEHIIARGMNRDLDQRIESAGGFLNAHTSRDAIQIEVTLPPDRLKLGLEALGETMQMPGISQADLDLEAKIIGHESALRELPDRISAAAWREAYGEEGVDPFGSLDVISHTTVQSLNELHHAEFVGHNLVISIAGPLDVDQATEAARPLLKAIPAGALADFVPRAEGRPGKIQIEGRGGARAAMVPNFRSPRTAWVLAAALSIAATMPHSFLIYTPTIRNGLIIVGQTEGSKIETAFDVADPSRLLRSARGLVRRWVATELQDPASVASFRGLLLVQSVTLRPEALLENLQAMTYEDFQKGLAAFSEARSVVVECK